MEFLKPKKHLLIIEEDCESKQDKEVLKEKIINKGTGAGGKNTNFHGKKFEEKTNNQTRLIEFEYNKFIIETKTNTKNIPFYLSKTFPDKIITFVIQYGLKTYMKYKYNIELFRCPDEAYIIEYHNPDKKVIKILEKKEQNVEGSVETKLWSGPSLKREYELVLGSDFEVNYCLCINLYLQNLLVSNNKKYLTLNKILSENKIDILFGDDENYFEMINNWITK